MLAGDARAAARARSSAANCRNDALARFPQLLVAPGLVAIIWNGLFDRFAPLDVRELDARPSRSPVRRKECAMIRRRIALRSLLAAAWSLAGCSNGKRADLSGLGRGRSDLRRPGRGRPRSRRCRCARATRSTLRAPLFTLDADLQQADVAMQEATVTNAQQAFDRAQQAAQDQCRDAEGASTTPRRHCAPRRRGSTRRRPGWRAARCSARSRARSQQVYFRAGEMVPAGRPVVALLPPGNLKLRFFVQRGDAAASSRSATPSTSAATAAPADLTAKISFIARTVGIHAAGDLQPGGARASSCS